MMKSYIASLAAMLLLVATGGCNMTTVKTTEQSASVIHASEQIPEDLLLDVGIGIFNPGVDALSDDDLVFPEVRKAEARYMPMILAETLQNSGNWGVVRVIPDRQSEMDVWVDAEILQSDGEFLTLSVKVQDTSGRTWFTRTYKQEASKYSYDKELRASSEPFQGIYNKIANDMLAYRRLMAADETKKLRTLTELKFAQRFAPEAFSDYLNIDEKGRYQITRLPADDDPLLQRIRRVRERDYLFVDTLQDYYGSFSRQMQEPYRQWRLESYKESLELRQTKSEATGRIIGGVLAAVIGIGTAIATSGSNSAAARTAGQAAGVIGGIAGAGLIKSGIAKNAEAKLHVESLREIAGSLDAEIEPHTLELEDRTVTLTGTVQQQYAQWRQILREMYQSEVGDTNAPQPVTAN